MIAVIPAYEPDKKLLSIVGELASDGKYHVIVIDDGSSAEKRPLFDELEKLSSVTVLRHESNRGKGRAMKTAFEWIKTQGISDDGIVTVDADGQHLLGDIEHICSVWEEHKDSLVLGGRRFTGKVPFKSRFGNGVTRLIFALTTGVRVYDTQTGLRAFSADMTDMMLGIEGERYEYEMNQLLTLTKQHTPIIEVPIETVYNNKNESSHFDPLKDSFRIYRMIFTFLGSSFVSWIVDYLLLLLLTWVFSLLTGGVGFELFGFTAEPKLPALVIARVVSSALNYLLNRHVVFDSKSKGSVFRYYLLAAVMLAVNYLLLDLLTMALPLWLAQIIVQLVIYPANFVIQKKFVFQSK